MPGRLSGRGHPHWPGSPPQSPVPFSRVLAAAKERQRIREPPPRRTARSPAVIDRRMTPDMRHRVDRARPAQRPAAWVGHRPRAGGQDTAGPGSRDRVPRKFLADRAREHGITLASASGYAPIDPDWLREQYLTRQRSYTGIAAELCVQDVTVIAAARRHGIPSRPPGVHSRPEMITRLGEDIPRAAEGSLKGWHRLRRFQIAMTFPTIEAAAAHLGARQSALIHQFRRLERDIGGTLYHRSAPGQPMRPTQRGAALLTVLTRPDIQAAATAHAPDVSGPPGGHGRYRERMPASPGSRTADVQQAVRLFRALAEPTRLAILLSLQQGNGASPTWPPNSAAPRPASPRT